MRALPARAGSPRRGAPPPPPVSPPSPPPRRAQPPLEDFRDAFAKQLDGSTRETFLGLHQVNLCRTFRFFHGTLGGNQALGKEPHCDELVLNFNYILIMFDKLGLFNPDLTIAKVRRFAVKISCNEEIAPQEHSLNIKARGAPPRGSPRGSPRAAGRAGSRGPPALAAGAPVSPAGRVFRRRSFYLRSGWSSWPGWRPRRRARIRAARRRRTRAGPA